MSGVAFESLVLWAVMAACLSIALLLFFHMIRNHHIHPCKLPHRLNDAEGALTSNQVGAERELRAVTVISHNHLHQKNAQLASDYAGLEVRPAQNLFITHADAQQTQHHATLVDQNSSAQLDAISMSNEERDTGTHASRPFHQNTSNDTQTQVSPGEPAPQLGLDEGAKELEAALARAHNLVAELEAASQNAPAGGDNATLLEKANAITQSMKTEYAKDKAFRARQDALSLENSAPILPKTGHKMRDNALLQTDISAGNMNEDAGEEKLTRRPDNKTNAAPSLKDRRAFKQYVPRQHRTDKTNQTPEQLMQSSLNRMRSIRRANRTDMTVGGVSGVPNRGFSSSAQAQSLKDKYRKTDLGKFKDNATSAAELAGTDDNQPSAPEKKTLLAKIFSKSPISIENLDKDSSETAAEPSNQRVDLDRARRGLELAKNLSRRSVYAKTSRQRTGDLASQQIRNIKASTAELSRKSVPQNED